MKKILIIPVVLLLSFTFANCEKDDICDANTMTTPRLVIDFYDATNPTLKKNVSNLKIVGVGMTDTLGTFNAVSTIFLPLKTTDDTVSYSFIFNSSNETLRNTDILQFNYTRDNLFVSRACGYKTAFTFADINAVVLSDSPDADQLSLQPQNIVVNTNNINSEDEAHITILF